MMTPPGRERAKTCTLERFMGPHPSDGGGGADPAPLSFPVLWLILHAQWASGRGKEKGLYPVLPETDTHEKWGLGT